ncbi:MAG: right-handed parallel beta-helix repeat-containing protein [Gemmatimonadota bacterium]|nr:right-handed parallel beta-helix repeat-containing protein [Gemmatimonadota bacterium]
MRPVRGPAERVVLSRILLLAGAVLSLAGTSVSARTWMVPADAPDIAAAVDSASAGDAVELACGVYAEWGISLKEGVTIRSADGDPACVTIDAGGAGRVFDAHQVQGAALVGLTIAGGVAAGGYPDGLGGGLRCTDADVSATDCVFRDHDAKYGGAIGCDGSSVALTACVFTGNAAYASDWAAGGAVFARGGAPVISGCSFSGNTAFATELPGDGGAVFLDSTRTTLTDCQFSTNATGAGAGALYLYRKDRSFVEACDFVGNSAGSGGAVYVEYSYPRFENCRVDSNTAANGGAFFVAKRSVVEVARCEISANEATPFSGGAFDFWNATGTITECTVAGNTAGVRGGAISAIHSSPEFRDCLLLANSTPGDGGALHCGDGSAPVVAGCTLYANAAGGLGGGVRGEAGSAPEIHATIVAAGSAGEAVSVDPACQLAVSCSDFFGNAGGDWTGALASRLDAEGNFSADPGFCDGPGGVFTLTLPGSPCLPENSPCGTLIGARVAGCGCPGNATLLVPDDHPTLAAALAAALPGDVVGLCAGDHSGPITLTDGIHLLGAGTNLTRVAAGSAAPALLHATALVEPTVVSHVTLDGASLAEDVVLVDGLSTGLVLSETRITGGVSTGIRLRSGSHATLGGDLSRANDIFGNGPGGLSNLVNESIGADSLDATLNWWGTNDYSIILQTITGPVRSCPITDSTHTKSLCAPLDALSAPESADAPALSLAIASNPSRGGATLLVGIAEASRLEVSFHDVRGRRICERTPGTLPAGRHQIVWDGRDASGQRVAAGVYFARVMLDGGPSSVRRVTVVR